MIITSARREIGKILRIIPNPGIGAATISNILLFDFNGCIPIRNIKSTYFSIIDMYQAIDKEKFELSPPKSDSALFSQLLEHSNEIIFLHPTLSLFFDNLTINRFIHKEIIVTFDFPFELPSAITINKLPPLKMESFKSNSLVFKVQIDGKSLEFHCVSPEFGLIWVLREVNSKTVALGLAILEFCDIAILENNSRILPVAKPLQLVLELGKVHLNRYDLIWEIIEAFGYRESLSDFPLFLHKFIRNDRKYDKIL